MKNLVKVLSIATLLSTSVFADGSGPSNTPKSDCEQKVISRVKNLIGEQKLSLKIEVNDKKSDYSNLSHAGHANKFIELTLNNESAGYVAGEIALLDKGTCLIQDMVINEVFVK